MSNNGESQDDMARVIKILEKENELLRTEIQNIYQEMELIRLRIPQCPCGNTMLSLSTDVGFYK